MIIFYDRIHQEHADDDVDSGGNTGATGSGKRRIYFDM
jgi:hypothetical protein